MTNPRADHPDAARSRLRGLVAAIERKIQDGAPGTADVLAPWTELVKALSLGPEPEVRECPQCHHLAMRMATLCSVCWSKLVPPKA